MQLNGSRKVIGVLRGYDVRHFPLPFPRPSSHPRKAPIITLGFFDEKWLIIMWFDSEQVFLNIVLDEAVEEKAGGEKVRIGMVVR